MNKLSMAAICNVLIFLATAVAAQSDNGSSNPVALAKQTIRNATLETLSQLSPLQRISLIHQMKRDLNRQANELTENDYLEAMTDIANMYWQNRAYPEASETYQQVANQRPESLFAANAHLMSGAIAYGNQSQPTKALPHLTQSVDILKRLDDGQASFDRDELTARAVSMLGDVYLVTGRKSEALKEYEYLLNNENVLAVAEESVIINANIESARILSAEGNDDQAIERYKTLEPLVRDSNLPANIRIGLSLESWDAHSRSGRTKDELIFHLEELWMSEREHDAFSVLQLGNNLSLLYFFSEDPKQREKFPSMAQELTGKIDMIRDSQTAKLSEKERQTMRSMFQQNKLMLAEFKLDRKDRHDLQVWLKKQIAEQQETKPTRFQPFVPTRFPKRVVVQLLLLHDKHIGRHLAAGKQGVEEKREAPADAVSVLDGR